MSSPNILLTRIDNRLVHGQVGVTWNIHHRCESAGSRG